MGIEQSGGTDARAEDADKPQAPQRPPGPPPDRPGQPGFPSRLESLRAAREAQEARAAELASGQAAPPETGTEQPDEREETAAESSPAEPPGERQGDQDDPKESEKGAEAGETESEVGSGLGERDDSPPGPENAEATRQDEPQAEFGTSDTDELAPETEAGWPTETQDEEVEPSPAGAAENPEETAEPGATEDPADQPETGPEADQAGRPDGHGEKRRAQDADEAAPRPPGEHDQSEARDRQPLPPQDGRPSVTTGTGQEAATGQILQADHPPTGHRQASQDAPGPIPAEPPEGTSDAQPPTEGDVQRTADGQFSAAETPEPSGMPGNAAATWPLEPEEGVTRWTSPVVQVGEGTPGIQVGARDRNAEARPESPATTDDETDKYRRLPEHAPSGTADHSDPVSPEDDPADRNPDPEDGRRSRWENFDRAHTAFDATKKVLRGVEDLQAKPPPTGRAEVRADTTIHAPDAHVGNPADALGNAVIVTLTVAGWALQTYRKIGNPRRRDHADN
ncbi:hypothetical protein [Actinomadura sp. WMMA1423]|uniref:hypothetical protein n=1 Tax=Actinomadura sp. WMMA1423 TaxID=2591108 RepID=UPI00143DB5D3|nr:hypothetical protein [Actinomadura sp. WMMA1423]